MADDAYDEDRPPICPRCGVTMVPSALSAEPCSEREHLQLGRTAEDWACLECEELGDD